MSEWSFRRKLITGVVLICMLVVMTSGASMIVSRILFESAAKVTTGEGRDPTNLRALELMCARNVAAVHACLISGRNDCVPAARASSSSLRERIRQMRAAVVERDGRILLDGVLIAGRAHEQAFTRALTVPGTARDAEIEAVRMWGTELEAAVAAFVTHMEAANFATARASVNRAEFLTLVITVLTIMLLALLCVVLIVGLDRSYRKQMAARTRAEDGQTQARTSLSEVETASRLKDEFLATVSHELRNPLAPILTWIQLLRSGTLDDKKSRRALEVIERNVLSQVQLIDDLVDVSRVASGKFRLDVRPINLVPVIKAAVESQAPACDAKQIRLQLVLDERAGLISGDSERLQQVMWNLISNAIKFTRKGGRVTVVLQRSESHVEIVVDDSGVGISADFLPHVFEPFQQAMGGSMRRHGGLGLGLSIVRHIVELHGGEITVSSEGMDLGSKFTVKFPLLATARGTDPEGRHPTLSRDALTDIRILRRLDGIRVLVVDDEPNASEALLVLFESCGAESRAAGSAAEAVALFEAWRPDVLVSDIAMPGEDGYALIRKIRQISPEKGGWTPAVALTAYGKIEDRVTILAAGFQMYLSKPADPNELVAVVGSLAKGRGMTNRPKGIVEPGPN